jgi:hypothetical protein
VGAVLAQKTSDGKLHPIAYASRQMKSAEKRYPAIEIEALAVYWAMKRFRFVIYGQHTTVVTDHMVLKSKTPKVRLANWAVNLQEYDYTVQHRAGKENANADAK